ncbi:hypothetical protein DSO57_1034453 [Entomophthora muscae]|uniref:Uncharacterized protein n=2 Tax=Entomophthora muscae TaxID=34485 RepID=A0ACC2TAV5_9FUNG|nr:hypothetical protein DSO57_1014716 [Entomophthora muscae]KAJ9071684.1 hypothetical protein DSO57_1034453 [Entomophthora muscae]
MSAVDAKKLKAVLKEGGKRAVEIVGVAETGGLEFFCTKLDEPEGELELMLKSLEAMNKPVDPTEEESKGGSGEIGKMIFSINNKQVAIVAYVPKEKVEKITAKAWLEETLAKFDGKLVSGEDEVATGLIMADAEKGIFSLKVRDEAIPTSIGYLRSKGLFPEQADDSDDSFVMGDDTDFDSFQ